MKRVYTQEERHDIQRVTEKVYKVLETTNNDLFFEVGRFGITLDGYAGSVDAQHHAISDYVYDDFTRADADRMIAELDVLGNFNKVFSDTKQDADSTEEE